jgi:CheY-like chemotaxis protein
LSVAAQRRISDPPAEPASGVRRRLRIIVADDNKDEVVTLATVLADEGHEVREVYRGDAVLRLITEFEPQAVFLDIGMPGMSGYAVARTLRERFGERAPLLVAVTGWKKASERLLGQIVGFDHYVTKPYEIDELLGLLAPLVAGATAADEQRLLLQAARLIGQEELARGLQVSETVLESWMEGRSSIPHRHLLNLADVLVTLASKLAKK